MHNGLRCRFPQQNWNQLFSIVQLSNLRDNVRAFPGIQLVCNRKEVYTVVSQRALSGEPARR
jgi:hypothetical protein